MKHHLVPEGEHAPEKKKEEKQEKIIYLTLNHPLLKDFWNGRFKITRQRAHHIGKRPLWLCPFGSLAAGEVGSELAIHIKVELGSCKAADGEGEWSGGWCRVEKTSFTTKCSKIIFFLSGICEVTMVGTCGYCCRNSELRWWELSGGNILGGYLRRGKYGEWGF